MDFDYGATRHGTAAYIYIVNKTDREMSIDLKKERDGGREGGKGEMEGGRGGMIFPGVSKSGTLRR
jgi:hypothetical protein